MHLDNGTQFLISEKLLKFSDRTHVDECDWSFDNETSTFQAVFISERFAKCLVNKKLPRGVAEVTEEDLATMANLASAELSRQLDEMGMMAVFNHSLEMSPSKLPEGYTLEVIYEDDQTDPSAPGIDWLAIA
ncbi:hypothetical protein D3C71_157620 [compost metagenome]